MSSHRDSFVASGSSPTEGDSPTTPDFLLENHFSIFLLRPISSAGFAWIEEHLSPDRITFGNAVVIEPRYVWAILVGLCGTLSRKRKRRRRRRWSSTDARTDTRSDGERNLCRDSDAHVGPAESNRRVAVERVKKACWNFEERTKRMSEPKVGPTEFAAEVERLKAEARFPSLETLLAAIAQVRAEFARKNLAARRQEIPLPGAR
jgi:hypothetical protein